MGRRTRIGPRSGSGKPPALTTPAGGSAPTASAVAHRDQAEPLGRGRIGGPVPVGGPQALQQGGRVALPPPDLDQAAHDRAHHLVAEGVGLDLEAQEAALARCAPASATSCRRGSTWPGSPGARSARRGWCRACAGRRSGSRGCPAARRRPPPWPAGRADRGRARSVGCQQGVGRRGVPDQVAVACGPWPSGGRRSSSDTAVAESTTMEGASWRLRARASPTPVEGDGRQVDVDHLAPGVHPGVGAAGTGQRGRLGHAGRAAQGVAQGAGHGRHLGLDRRSPGRRRRRRPPGASSAASAASEARARPGRRRV